MLYLQESDDLTRPDSTCQSFQNIIANPIFLVDTDGGLVVASVHVVLGDSFTSLINEMGPKLTRSSEPRGIHNPP